jgi:hypothetical protein
LKIVTAAHNPVLASDEAAGAYWDVRELEGLDDRLRFVRPDVYMAAVEGGENLSNVRDLSYCLDRFVTHPWLCWVKVNAFHALAASEQLSLYLKVNLGSHVDNRGQVFS